MAPYSVIYQLVRSNTFFTSQKTKKQKNKTQRTFDEFLQYKLQALEELNNEQVLANRMRFREQTLKELESRKKFKAVMNPNDIIIKQRKRVSDNWERLKRNVAKLHFDIDFLNNKCRDIDKQAQAHLQSIKSMYLCSQYMKNLYGVALSECTLRLQQILRENEEEENKEVEVQSEDLNMATIQRIEQKMESDFMAQ